jgi:hypothetical protein
VLLIVAALGLATFGVFGLCEARWRRVKPAVPRADATLQANA